MPTTIEHILLRDEWNEADRLALRRAVEADPKLGLAMLRWFEVSSRASVEWTEDVPSRQALVLLACKDRFDEEDLSLEERALLADAAAALASAVERHPAVGDILERIQQEAAAFETAWAHSFSGDVTPRRAVSRTDRGPLRGTPESPSSPLRLVRIAMAAAAVIAILVVGRSWFDADLTGPEATYTAQSTMQVVSLEDGSQVRLAPSATLDVAYDEDSAERRVRLSGDAFFDVAPGTRPFRVETSNAVTTVLGTTFGIRTDDGTEVMLVTGRVSLASTGNPDEAIILSAGEQGTLSTGAIQAEISSFTTLEGFDWSGLLVFRNTPMSAVAEQLSKEFNISISLSEELKEAPLTGTFESERGSKAILDIIASALGATVTKLEDGSYHLSA